MSDARLVAVNLLAFVDQGEVGTDPYRIDRDGVPYVAVGDGGLVLGLRLGDSVFGHVGDHAAPGVCLIHPQEEARRALVGLACLGNQVTVRTGAAIGAVGAVLGKRGGGERVIAVFAPDALSKLRPHDQLAITSHGQGARSPRPDVAQMNISRQALAMLGITSKDGLIRVGVRQTFSSRQVGNGIGRPMAMWDVDLQVEEAEAPAGLCLGDLVAIADLDARTNAGFRRQWISIGVVVHGASPQPGHGPGVTIVLSGPATSFWVEDEGEQHHGLTEERLLTFAGTED